MYNCCDSFIFSSFDFRARNKIKLHSIHVFASINNYYNISCDTITKFHVRDLNRYNRYYQQRMIQALRSRFYQNDWFPKLTFSFLLVVFFLLHLIKGAMSLIQASNWDKENQFRHAHHHKIKLTKKFQSSHNAKL